MSLFSKIKNICKKVFIDQVLLVAMIATVVVPILAQTVGNSGAVFPGGIVNSGNTLIAANRALTTVSSNVGVGDTTINVTATTLFPGSLSILAATGIVIDNEYIKVCASTSTTFTVCTNGRGFDGSTATTHNTNASVYGYVLAAHTNQLAAEVQAIESSVATNFAYKWSAQPGTTLNSGVSNTVTVTPCPLGTNGTDVGHYLYITGGTGTTETTLLTGGTCTSGVASGTLIFTPANSHSGAYAIGTATAGIQEDLNVSPYVVNLNSGSYTVHGPTTLPSSSPGIKGSTAGGTVITVAIDFPTAVNGIFIGPNVAGNGPEITNLTVSFTEPDSTNIATYTHWPAAFYMVGTARFVLRNIFVLAGWDGVNMTGNAGGAILENIQMSTFDKGIAIDGAQDSVYLTKVRFWPYGLTTNQNTVFSTNSTTYGVYCARMDDLHVTDFFADNTNGLYFYTSASGSPIAHLTNVTLDTSSAFTNTSTGWIDVNGLYVSQGVVGTYTPFASSAGEVHVTNGFFFPGASNSGTAPYIAVTGGITTVTNVWFWTGSYDQSTITESAGELIAMGNYFNRSGNVSYTNPTVNVTGGRITFIGNRASDKGSGTGNLVAVSVDNWNQIRANSFVGWGLSIPATITSGNYEADLTQIIHASVTTSNNYIATETGANSAIAGALVGASASDGQCVTVQLAHTLTGGSGNTFALNGGSAVNIRSRYNTSTNIATSYTASGRIYMCYNSVGPVWMDMSQ